MVIVVMPLFVVVLVRLRQRSPGGEPVPVVMRDTIEFLSEHGNNNTFFFFYCVFGIVLISRVFAWTGLEIEGIFRRSANITLVKDVQLKYNSGRIDQST